MYISRKDIHKIPLEIHELFTFAPSLKTSSMDLLTIVLGYSV